MNNSSKREKIVNSTKSVTIDEDSYLKNNTGNQESIAVSNDYKYNFSDQMIKSNIEDSGNIYNDFNYQSGGLGLSGSNTFKNVIGSKEVSYRDGNIVNKNYESRNSEIKEEIQDDDDDGFEPINYD